MQKIDLTPLGYTFKTKPLLIGGKAMEFYGLRKAGTDIDFVITHVDYASLSKMYPKNLLDLYGDKGVITKGLELWTSICLFDINNLDDSAIEQENYNVIALDKLLFLKTLAQHIPKYHKDVTLIVKKILDIQYGKDTLPSS